jgi:hypothetical protein
MRIIGEQGVPLGLGMALAQNSEALNRFAAFNEFERKSVIARTHGIQSKEEMQAFVTSFVDGGRIM